jgi:hypothetical protein
MRTAALLVLALLAGCATPPERPQRDAVELLASRRAEDTRRTLERGVLMERFLARVEAKADATVDLLVISGGGDWGAFGAGVLKGWGRVQGELARPQFDAVTGVSTGALIAPFAFLGDEASLERIVQLYRNPQSDIATSRGWLFFLPDNPSLYVLPGLERELRRTIDRLMLERIVAEGAKGRGLLVNTTNVDLGDNRVWDLVAEAKASLAGDEEHVRRVLLASAGIPAVFPARGIGDYLYVDGAITGNIIYGGETRDDQSLPARWQARHPRRPMPRVRYWVIFKPDPFSAAGHARPLARHHGPHHHHGDADLDPELAAPPLRHGRDRAAQVQGAGRGAPDLGAGGLRSGEARHLRERGHERARRPGRAHGRRPEELAHRGALARRQSSQSIGSSDRNQAEKRRPTLAFGSLVCRTSPAGVLDPHQRAVFGQPQFVRHPTDVRVQAVLEPTREQGTVDHDPHLGVQAHRARVDDTRSISRCAFPITATSCVSRSCWSSIRCPALAGGSHSERTGTHSIFSRPATICSTTSARLTAST